MADEVQREIWKLDSSYSHTRWDACGWLGELGDARAIEPLIAALPSAGAAQALDAIGVPAVPRIAEALVEELHVSREETGRWGRRRWQGCRAAIGVLRGLVPSLRQFHPQRAEAVCTFGEALPHWKRALRMWSGVPREVKDALRELVREAEPVVREIVEDLGTLLRPVPEPEAEPAHEPEPMDLRPVEEGDDPAESGRGVS